MDNSDIILVRAVLGMTKREFAEKLGYSVTHLKRVESGEDPVTLKMHVRVLALIDTKEYRDRLVRLQDLPGETRGILNDC